LAMAALACGPAAALEVMGRSRESRRQPNAMSLAEVMVRFQEMQTKVDELTLSVNGIDDEIAEVENAAKTTRSSIATAETTLASVSTRATENAETAKIMAANAKTVKKTVNDAIKRVDELQGVLETLEGTAVEMGTDSLDVGKKITELEDMMRELLPGTNDATSRLNHVAATIKAYQKEADAGIDRAIVDALERKFGRAKSQVDDLAKSVTEAAIEDGRLKGLDPCEKAKLDAVAEDGAADGLEAPENALP